MTLIVNLYAGPGAGKSTTAAGLFAALKTENIEAELVHEYAKDLTWEDRKKGLSFQPLILGKQAFKLYRLVGETDVVITDSPLLLCPIYRGDGCTTSFDRYVLELYNTFNNLNIFLARGEAQHYSPEGRNQTEVEARRLDRTIYGRLYRWQQPIMIVPVNEYTVQRCVQLVKLVKERLDD